ncbi:MAG: hypothetical protein LBD94_02845 [Rickettsiales bacterium]|jgi:chromosome segregation ATPase|nr:hypothetical protein [Rickettsiales bacterium]
MKKYLLFAVCAMLFAPAYSDDAVDVESYDAESSVFQKIADLEQEKVLMQLEKEKAQLQLDLDRLAAEQTRLARDQENADMRAEEQAAELEKQKLALEQERQKLEEQKKKLAEEAAKTAAAKDEEIDSAGEARGLASALDKFVASQKESGEEKSISERYFLREIIGAGNQLFATVEDVVSGKQKKISVGKKLDDYTVKSISIDDGIEFEKDGEITTLNVGRQSGAADMDE